MLKDFSKEKFDIIIQAGQSNSEGTAFGLTDEPYQPDIRVWYMNGWADGCTIDLAEEASAGTSIRGNFSLPFARDYIENGCLAEDRKLLILRTAVGGTGFLDNRWKKDDDLCLRMHDMIRTALDLNPENRLVALLWHQGETDACCHASYNVHHRHLESFIRGVRTAYHCPELPFIAGNFVPQWIEENPAICAPVIDAMRDVCKTEGPAAFVETDGLLSNLQDGFPHPCGWVDTIHFCRRSIFELGHRYFQAYRDLLPTR